MDEPTDDVMAIGASLVHAAREIERSPGELIAELFPYIFEASRRMSTRAICRWLKDNHDLEISQSSLSRALRAPDKHWGGFAEALEPKARIASDALGLSLHDTLFDDHAFDALSFQYKDSCPELAGITKEDCMRDFDRNMEVFQTLRTGWFSLSPETRSYCWKYFQEADDPEEKAQE